MDRLEQYVESGEYFRDKSDLDRWRKLLVEALAGFRKFPVPGENRWSYRVPHEGVAPGPSSSTSAMILFTIARCLGMLEPSMLVPFSRRLPKKKLSDNLATELRARFDEAVEDLKSFDDSRFLHSETWGRDDPLTLVWLNELTKFHNDNRVRERIDKTLQRALNGKPILDWTGCMRRGQKPPIYANHMLPVLRCVQLWFRLESKLDIEAIRKASWATLHTQLTAAELPHGDFDAAELVHAAEAIMLIEDGPKSLGPDLLTRIFKTLRERQDRSAYWRPLKPITQSPRGPVLLPISVEIANSILRIHAWMCETNLAANEAQSRIDLARRYATWLETRARHVKTLDSPDKRVLGWASEHIDEPNVIHTWQTSQVLLFLADLIEAVDRQMGVRMREGGLFELVEPDQRADPVATREPLLSLVPKANGSPATREILPYTVVRDRFIDPRSADKEADVSMLLYGPPGTGKTSFAGQLAKHLGWKLLTITPSDFIAGGVEQVERRAKAIFAMLEHQRKTVVLLDEIDRLILDRDRPDYVAQGDMFQSMTPSMLGKINELRKHCTEVVFIIGTNFKERIDPAIIRPGRIDQACLLAPPDQAQREAILNRLLPKLGADQITRHASRTALMVYTELEGVADAIKAGAKPEEAPAIRIGSYGRRFQPVLTPHQMPLLEFWVLVALEQEGRGKRDDAPAHPIDRSAQRALVKGTWAATGLWKVPEEEKLLVLQPEQNKIERSDLEELLKHEELDPAGVFLEKHLEKALEHYKVLEDG